MHLPLTGWLDKEYQDSELPVAVSSYPQTANRAQFCL